VKAMLLLISMGDRVASGVNPVGSPKEALLSLCWDFDDDPFKLIVFDFMGVSFVDSESILSLGNCL
jgi:hypothetical protein